MLIQIEYNYY